MTSWEVGSPRGPFKGVEKQGEFFPTPDERDVRPLPVHLVQAGARSNGLPGRQRESLSLGPHRLGWSELDDVPGGAVSRLVDQDAVDRRGLRESETGVQDVPGCHP